MNSTPMGFADLTGTLITVWVSALFYAIAVSVIARYLGKLPSRPVMNGVLQFLAWGGIMTILGIGQRANELGHMTYPLSLFIFVVAVMAAVCVGWLFRLRTPPKT